ncbi:F0F1 ATP synthase subunit epsilon [Roseovarius nitratireducens]|uniref:F0F1 ATP synthase subunit epsilon n=1 Tax=Roseovarius nitratireducens TaxID=2044597 RepID=UPI000CE25B82|nr:F0F1 ATP synthase subunit epsilon [Roseovarius nitratireducens]
MAETVQFDLVSPERLLASVEAREVLIPGAEGDMTALPDHAPLITTLRPGIIRVSGVDGDKEYVVTGGFAEINGQSISVLAERALPRADVTKEDFQAMVDEATERLNRVKEQNADEHGLIDDATKLLHDMVAVGDHIGMSPN